ncbi:phosphatidate cytidylyltransferase [Chloropicon primus]|uniref:Phosphatidate cytidylyltransferase n=2 Tax=Chloropicon primus TaxID=1764295 RepID=A0A5B8MKY4_9CHLO|nr:phosphatidate cytidylyltransferase [Chloropicon primus]UPQ99244.1 phosphatidate cytidylyltransferase [Chloropicon primus]|eukprot:QDZ20032.1 phosphatidate cytidylyltransferase [Chloropicon primus]
MGGGRKVRSRGKGKREILKSHPMELGDSRGSSGEWEVGGSPEEGSPKSEESKFSSLYVRTLSGVALALGFGVIIRLGHLYCLVFLLCIQAVITRELFDLARKTVNMKTEDETKDLPGFRVQQWYIFSVACFYMYGRLLHEIILVEVSSPNSKATTAGKVLMSGLWFVLKRHMLITYFLYVIGFVMGVLSLKKGKLRYQFGQYASTIAIILFVLVQTSFFVANIFDGLIWFVLPCALVIVNDIMAYFAGKGFGRTPLIKLSPKKTMEGFVGGGALTVLLSIPLSEVMSRFEWLTCSRSSFAKENLECRYSQVFEPALYHMTDFIPSVLHQFQESWLSYLDFAFEVKPIVIHGIFLAIFASSIAPFGGFFASGVKRALKIKDFGDSIPGHGGLTDRMDCQCVMAVFSYVWVRNFVDPYSLATAGLLSRILLLDKQSKLALFTRLGYLLHGQGVLPAKVVQELNKIKV